DPKLVEAARTQRLAASGTSSAANTTANNAVNTASQDVAPKSSGKAAPSAPKQPRADAALAALVKRLAGKPGLTGRLHLKARDTAAAWTLDLSAQPVLSQGLQGVAQAVLSANDAVLADWVEGKQTLRALYQKGDLRVD